MDTLTSGEEKNQSLPQTGLGSSDNILPSKRDWDAPGLNGSHRRESHVFEPILCRL